MADALNPFGSAPVAASGMGDAMANLYAARNAAQAAGRGGSSKPGSMRPIIPTASASAAPLPPPSNNPFGLDPVRGPEG